MRLMTLPLLLAGLATPLLAQDGKPMARGADIGWLSQMEADGTPFYDANGNAADCLKTLKSEGINAIRLRVWVNPSGGWCGKDDVVKMAKRAVVMGFRIMIDFHYSDNWADPQHQPKPAAWRDHNIVQLQKDVYDHTFDVLTTLKQAGITPQWVQIGNEITYGMLWPEGKTPRMADLVGLINQGYNAVKAVDPNMAVVIHLNNGASNGMFRHWFDEAIADGVHFDVIGLSFYPGAQGLVAGFRLVHRQHEESRRDV
jgi:arabinogalactan endo-1,4-beta-galactosidase